MHPQCNKLDEGLKETTKRACEGKCAPHSYAYEFTTQPGLSVWTEDRPVVGSIMSLSSQPAPLLGNSVEKKKITEEIGKTNLKY
jgi:hypothetical protein